MRGLGLCREDHLTRFQRKRESSWSIPPNLNAQFHALQALAQPAKDVPQDVRNLLTVRNAAASFSCSLTRLLFFAHRLFSRRAENLHCRPAPVPNYPRALALTELERLVRGSKEYIQPGDASTFQRGQMWCPTWRSYRSMCRGIMHRQGQILPR